MSAVVEAMGAITSGIDALLALELSTLQRQELLELISNVEIQTRRLPAVDHKLLAQVEERGVAAELAYSNTASLLSDLLRLAPREASARVVSARELGPRRELNGTALPALFPAAAAAQENGSISVAHARVITSLHGKLPDLVVKEHGEQIETFLVQHAKTLDPAQLARAALRMRELLDPEGLESTERDHDRRRAFSLHAFADGSADVSGHLTAAANAVWRPILDALAAPAPSADGQADPRSPGQRRHDALLDAGQRLLRSGTLPDCGGTPVTILATIRADELLNAVSKARADHPDEGNSCSGDDAPAAHAVTGHGDLISIESLMSLATEAGIVPVVLNDSGAIMSFGRTRRLATAGQRLALAARDGGCSFPGCTRPPTWCQTHHVRPWIDNGNTDLDNLTLVCGHHHREFDKRGWRCQMINAVPHWIPPAWLDAAQVPRRNTAHHVEIIFDVDAA